MGSSSTVPFSLQVCSPLPGRPICEESRSWLHAGVLCHDYSHAPAEWANLFRKAAKLDGSGLDFGCAPSEMTSCSLQDPTARREKDGACP